MKRMKCLLLPFLVVCALMFSFKVGITPVYADETNQPTEGTNTNHEETTGCNSYTTQEERDQCIKDRAANLSTAPFYSTAIMSLDTKISEKELSQDYIKNFSNSSVTALSYNLSLFDPDTIIMHIVNIVISLIEMIGQAISLVVLILYNVASGSFWKTIIQGVFDLFDKAIFNWGDPNSWFIKILFLFGSLSVAMKLMSQWNKHFTINTLVSITAQVVVSCMMVVFIAQYGRGIISNIETMATESITQNFNLLEDQYDSSLPLEVNVKNQIFDIMQKQGFILRHFGVTTADQIKDVENVKISDGSTATVTGKERVKLLLNEPSQRRSYMERKALSNDQIGYSSGRVLAILGISVIFLIHRVLMGLLIGSASLLLLGIGFLKEITIATSVYALVFMLFKKDKRLAFNWFFGRMKWMLAFILSNLIFNMFLSFVILLINGVSAQKASLLIILPFDAILCLAVYYLVTHAPELWQKLMADFDIEGNDGIINLAKGVIGGDITPGEMWNKFKNRNDSSECSSSDSSASSGHKSLTNMAKDNDELSESDSENDINHDEDLDTFSDNNDSSSNEDIKNIETADVDQEDSSITNISDENSESMPGNRENIDNHSTLTNASEDDISESEPSDQNMDPDTIDQLEISEEDQQDEIEDILSTEDNTNNNENYITATDEDLSENDEDDNDEESITDNKDNSTPTSTIKEENHNHINDENHHDIKDSSSSDLSEEVPQKKENIVKEQEDTDESLNQEEFKEMEEANDNKLEEEKSKDMDDFMESLI